MLAMIEVKCMSLEHRALLTMESESEAAVFFCRFCMQTRTRSATRLLFLLPIPLFPTSLVLGGAEWEAETASRPGPFSESLLSDMFLALDEAFSLWVYFIRLLPEDFFLDRALPEDLSSTSV
jgi:hypothetical protein